MTKRSSEEIVFVKKPSFPTKCTSCNSLMLEDVYQTTCCGALLCATCDEMKKKSNKSHCKKSAHYKANPDQNAKNLIQTLVIYCPNKKTGCIWEGQTHEYKDHIKKGKRSGDCQYEVVGCCHKDCKEKDARINMDKHELQCPERPHNCQYCKETIKYKDIGKHNDEKCPDIIVGCTKCNVAMKRRELKTHKCDHAMVQCKYYDVGCKDEMKRKDLKSHMHDKVSEHLGYVHVEFKQAKEKIEFQEKEIETLKKKQEKLQEMHKKSEEELKELQKQFQEQLNELQKQLNEQAAESQKQFQEQLNELQKQLNEQAAELQKQFQEQLNEQAAESQKQFQEQLNKLQKKLNKQAAESQKQFQEQLKELQKKLAAESQKQFQDQLDELEKKLAAKSQTSESSPLQSKVEDLQREVAKLKNWRSQNEIAQLNGRVHAFEEQLQQLQARRGLFSCLCSRRPPP